MAINSKAKEKFDIPVSYYLLWILAFWSIFIVLSLVWNMKTTRSGTLEVARIEARTAFEKDVVYRRWNAGHGGVYAPIAETNQPNPYLDVPEREITTPLGLKLTKVNPAYMTRQVHELALKTFGIRGHITSLNPIRPANKPDPWEAEALKSFQKGLKEVSSVEKMEGKEYMRLMQPLITEKGCLKCHAIQGYKIGDIRGGISVSIPMAPHMAIEQSKILTLYVIYGLVWLVGFVGIGIGMSRLNQQIHKRRAKESALEESEERYRSVTEAIKEGVILQAQSGEILTWNKGAENIFGILAKDVIGQINQGENWPTIHEDGSKFYGKDHLFMRMGTGKAYTNEIMGIYQPSGDLRWISVSTNPLLSKNSDKPYAVAISFSDITDLKKVEQSLRENEAFTKSVLDNLPIGVAVNSVDPTVEFSYMNDNFLKFYRTTREKLTDPDIFWEAVYEDSAFREEIKKKVLDDCASGDPERMNWVDIPISRKGEVTSFITAKNIPIPKKNFMISTIWDVTDRKQALKALKKNEELLRSTQELTKVGGWEWNLEKQAIFWTNEVYRIHDFEPDQFKSGTTEHIEASLKCYDPEDLPTIQNAFQKCYKKGIAYDLEFPLTTAKGRRIWIRTVTKPVFKNDKIVKVIGNIIDITEQKQAEIEKEKLESQLRQMQRIESIGNLAGGIAHDFNNLLYPIIGMSEMLLEDLPQDSFEHEKVQAIFNAGRRAGDLVKQILAFSRQSEHTMTPVRVQNVLKEVLKLSRSTIPANIEIHETIQQNCGSVMADPTQVHQVAMNLITNAFHATEEKNGIIDIELKEITLKNNELLDSLLQSGQYVMLSVSDNGIGMAQSTIDKVFEPYFTTKGKGKGTGLGLAVVHGIVKEHKGDVKVYSEVEKGTTFNIYLPLMIKAAEKSAGDQVSQIEIGTENLLLVDDEVSVAKLGKLMLERLGYKVTVQTSSVDALDVFKASPESFDLVITDMTMPSMTGDQLAREMLLIKPNIPIIICTGFSERVNKEQAEVIGVKGFLMKPVVKFDMAQMVRKVLDEAKNSNK